MRAPSSSCLFLLCVLIYQVRAGVLAGIKSCLLEGGAHTLEMADDFPTDLPSYSCMSIAELPPPRERVREILGTRTPEEFAEDRPYYIT